MEFQSYACMPCISPNRSEFHRSEFLEHLRFQRMHCNHIGVSLYQSFAQRHCILLCRHWRHYPTFRALAAKKWVATSVEELFAVDEEREVSRDNGSKGALSAYWSLDK